MDYNKYSKDVHTIIDNLSKEESNHIGNGYWVDSDHIIYRKVEYMNNKPVGFIDVYSLPKFKRYGLIIIAVSKEARGKGIGKKLVNSAIQNCKNNKDIDKLRWLADSDNTASINMPKSLGFKLNGDGEDKKEFIYDISNLNRLKRTMSESGDNIDMFDELSLTESCKDIDTARKFLQEADDLSKKYDANFFIVTDDASMTRNGRGKSEPAVKNARDSQIEWEKKNGGDPDEDWLKHTNESTLPSKDRRKLDDDVFGIPSLRKYPLNDKAHVLAAIRMFNRVDRKHEKELAHNIIAAMEKYKISKDIIGPKNRLQSYI